MIGGDTGTPRWKSTGPGDADAGAAEPGHPDLGHHLAQHLERERQHDLRPLPDVALAVLHAERGQPPVGDADREAGGADRDAGEPDVGREVDQRRASAAARGRRPDLDGQPELAQPDHLGADRRARDLESVGQLGLGERPLVPQLREETGLQLALGPPCQRVPHGRILPRADDASLGLVVGRPRAGVTARQNRKSQPSGS